MTAPHASLVVEDFPHDAGLKRQDETTAGSTVDAIFLEEDETNTREGTTGVMTDDATISEVTIAIGDGEEQGVTHDVEVPPRTTSTKSMNEIATQTTKSTSMTTKGTMNGTRNQTTSPDVTKEGRRKGTKGRTRTRTGIPLDTRTTSTR